MRRAPAHISDYDSHGRKHVYSSQGVGYASPAKATARSLVFCQHYATSAPAALFALLARFCDRAWPSGLMSAGLHDRMHGRPDPHTNSGPLCLLTAEFATDGQLAGFVTFRRLPVGLEEPGSCELCDVVVGPRFRKQGIATSLVRHCLAVIGMDTRVRSVRVELGRRGGICSTQIEAVMIHNGFVRQENNVKWMFHFSSWPEHQRPQNLSAVVVGPSSSNLLQSILEQQASSDLAGIRQIALQAAALVKTTEKTNSYPSAPFPSIRASTTSASPFSSSRGTNPAAPSVQLPSPASPEASSSGTSVVIPSAPGSPIQINVPSNQSRVEIMTAETVEENGERFATAMETSAASVAELNAILQSKNDLIRRLQGAVRTLNSRLVAALSAQHNAQKEISLIGSQSQTRSFKPYHMGKNTSAARKVMRDDDQPRRRQMRQSLYAQRQTTAAATTEPSYSLSSSMRATTAPSGPSEDAELRRVDQNEMLSQRERLLAREQALLQKERELLQREREMLSESQRAFFLDIIRERQGHNNGAATHTYIDTQSTYVSTGNSPTGYNTDSTSGDSNLYGGEYRALLQHGGRERVLSATEIHIDGKTIVGTSSPAPTMDSPKRRQGSSPPLPRSSGKKRLSASQLGSTKSSLAPQQPAANHTNIATSIAKNATPGNRASAQSTRVKKKGWGVLRSAVLGSGDKVQQLKDRLAIEQALDEAAEAGSIAAQGKKRAGRVPRSPKVFNAINSALEVGQASLKTGGSVPSSPRRAGNSSNPASPSRGEDLETLPPPASSPEDDVTQGVLQMGAKGNEKGVNRGNQSESNDSAVLSGLAAVSSSGRKVALPEYFRKFSETSMRQGEVDNDD